MVVFFDVDIIYIPLIMIQLYLELQGYYYLLHMLKMDQLCLSFNKVLIGLAHLLSFLKHFTF